MFFIIFFIILNILLINSAVLGVFFGSLYFLINGKRLGRWIFPETPAGWQIISGFFFILSFFSLIGGAIYYFYQLNILVIILLLISIPAIIKKLEKKWPTRWRTAGQNIIDWLKIIQNVTSFILRKDKITYFIRDKILTCSYFFSFIILSILLSRSATTEAVQSPWLIISKCFFIIYIIATLLLIAIILREKKHKVSLFFIILHTFLSASVALIVYKLGYGFDPFIHQATEKVIFEHGLITPKPLYYLGQYSMAVMIAKIFQINVIKIDKLLVPFLFSVYAPSFIYFSFKKAFAWEEKHTLLAALSFLLLPYTAFITTTPQALANIYAVIIIFLGLIYLSKEHNDPSETVISPAQYEYHEKHNNKYLLWILIFLAANCAIIHPLTGIPAIIFIILVFLINKDFKFKKISLFLISLFSAAALPIIFFINSLISSSLKIELTYPSFQLSNFVKFGILNDSRQYNLLRDFIYFYGFNIITLFLAIAAIGIVIFFKSESAKMASSRIYKIILPYLLTFLILTANYLILRNFIIFKNLISYEQNIYSLRILGLSLYFLLPFFLASFYYFFKKLMLDKSSYLKISFLLFLALWLTVSLYLTYPRNDNYVSDHGYNVSENDFKTAQYINQNAKLDYIVLANQNLSAASLTEYGFHKYFKSEKYNEIFYYPIPTSSPLYQYYSDMVTIKPSRETMNKAMDLAGVKEGYFAINSYWWQADQIIARAKMEADEWKEIDNGKIWIFKYVK